MNLHIWGSKQAFLYSFALCVLLCIICNIFQFRNPFLDQESSLNESSEKINQQRFLKLGVFYFLKILSLCSWSLAGNKNNFL